MKKWLISAAIISLIVAPAASWAQSSKPLSQLNDRGTVQGTDLMPILPAGTTTLLKTTVNSMNAFFGGGGGGGGGLNIGFIGAVVPGSASYTGLNNGAGLLIGWKGDTNGYADVNVMNTPTVTIGNATIAITASALPLPAGAASAANQTAVQAAPGSSSSTAVGVQGVSGGVAVPVSVASLPLPAGAATAANQATNAAQGSTTSGQTGPLMQCAVTTSNPAYTTAQTDPLSCDPNGNLRMGLYDGVTGAPVSLASGVAGTPAGGVTTVQGQTGMTPLQTQPAAIGAPQSYTALAGTGVLAAGSSNGVGDIQLIHTAIATGATLELDYGPTNSGPWIKSGLVATSGSAYSTFIGVANAIYHSFPEGAYWRLYQSAYSSGTTTGTVTLLPTPAFTMALPVNSMSATFNQGANNAMAAAVVAQNADTPTATTANNFGAIRESPNHALIVLPYDDIANNWTFAPATGGLSNTTTAVTIKAADTNRKNCITGLQIGAGTLGAATEVAIRDGAAGTVLWRGFMPTSGGYQDVPLPTPICNAAVNTLLEAVTLTATVSGGVYVNAQGFMTK